MSENTSPVNADEHVHATINGEGIEYRVVLDPSTTLYFVSAHSGPSSAILLDGIEYLEALDFVRNEIVTQAGQSPEMRLDTDAVVIYGERYPILEQYELQGHTYVIYRMFGGEAGIARIA